MNNRLKWVVVALGCALAVPSLGCSSSDGDQAAPVPLEKLPQQFANTLCDAIAPCCKAGEVTYSAPTCKSTVTDTFTALVTDSAGATYDANAAGACLSKLKAKLDACSAVDDEGFYSDCQGIFKGTLPAGAACERGAQCASTYCAFDFTLGSGTCAVTTGSQTSAHPHAKAGEGCQGECFTNDGLVMCTFGGATADAPYCFESDGLYCGFDSQVCAPLVAVGAPCENAECVAGSYCDFDHGTVCTPIHDSGPCNASASSSVTGCSDKSYCSSVTQNGGPGQCLTKKPDGYSCQLSEECASQRCNSAGTCGNGPAATSSQCAGDFDF